MTKNQSLGFRFLLFIAGACIIFLSFFLTKGNRELTRIDAFFWVSVSLMYLFLFLPFFFSSIDIKNFSKKIPIVTITWFWWFGISFYVFASITILILLTKFFIISFNTAIIIQSILLLFFFIVIYFAYFAGSYVAGVNSEEVSKQQYLSKIKSNAQLLLLSIENLPAEYDVAKKSLKQSLDDIRYLSPLTDGAGTEIESRIFQIQNNLALLINSDTLKGNLSSIESEAEILKIQVNQRKLLRN